MEAKVRQKKFDELDNEAKEFVDYSSVMKEMESAFGGAGLGNKTTKETSKTQAVALYNEGDQRKKRNEDLQKRVQQHLKKQSQVKAIENNESSIFNKDLSDPSTFITGVKNKENKKKTAVLDSSDEEEEEKADEVRDLAPFGKLPKKKVSSKSVKLYKSPEEELIEGIDAVGDEFHKMMLELNEMEDAVNGKDIEKMEDLMGVTNEYMDEHIKFSEKLEQQVMNIHQQAQKSIELSI